jgi:hypothetical protein
MSDDASRFKDIAILVFALAFLGTLAALCWSPVEPQPVVDNRKAVALAEIDADSSLSDLEKTQRRREVSNTARTRRTENELGTLDTAAQIRATEIARTRDALGQQDTDVARAQANRDRIAALNLSQRAAARVLGINERTSRRFALKGVPDVSDAVIITKLKAFSMEKDGEKNDETHS